MKKRKIRKTTEDSVEKSPKKRKIKHSREETIERQDIPKKKGFHKKRRTVSDTLSTSKKIIKKKPNKVQAKNISQSSVKDKGKKAKQNNKGYHEANTLGENDRREVSTLGVADSAAPIGTASTEDLGKVKTRLESTLKHILRKGRKLRPDAQPPTLGLTRAICRTIALGNHAEVAARAFGIRPAMFKSWVLKGFEDIASGESTPYAIFVAAVDTADAQAEVQDIASIRQCIEGWQSLAWLRERKSFQRWGMRSLQLSGDVSELPGAKKAIEEALDLDTTADVLSALESAGIVMIPGSEEHSGEVEVLAVESKATRDEGDTEAVTLTDD